MAQRKYSGQLYQSATTSAKLTTDDGFEFKLQTWEDLKLKLGAEKKLQNQHDGSVGGWTSDVVKTSAGIKMRLDEWLALEEAWTLFDPTTPILQQQFTMTIVYGNVVGKLKKDVALVMFQDIDRDVPKSQDPLMCDKPLLLLDLVENGYRALQYPV